METLNFPILDIKYTNSKGIPLIFKIVCLCLDKYHVAHCQDWVWEFEQKMQSLQLTQPHPGRVHLSPEVTLQC